MQQVIYELYKKYKYPESFKLALTEVAKLLPEKEIVRILAWYESADNFRIEEMTEIVKELSIYLLAKIAFFSNIFSSFSK